jgi:hypothetical protein
MKNRKRALRIERILDTIAWELTTRNPAGVVEK